MTVDPLARAGRQDLTADVDFAALDLHGREQGFESVLFTTLTAFLHAGGAQAELEALRAAFAPGPPVPSAPVPNRPAPDEAADPLQAAGLPGGAGLLESVGLPEGADVLEADRQATVLANLLDESDLGGAFKVMVQVRG